jgi:hypothetical protein
MDITLEAPKDIKGSKLNIIDVVRAQVTAFRRRRCFPCKAKAMA